MTKRILGLDVGRNNVTACLLTEFPDQPVRHFQNIRKEIVKCQADMIGVQRLLDLKPDAIIMEPTGIWYSSFWRHLAEFHKIPIHWVGHGDLAAQRGAYGFKNKRDIEAMSREHAAASAQESASYNDEVVGEVESPADYESYEAETAE